MCIICAMPRGHLLTDEQLTNCWDSNPDGGGYMFVNKNSEIVIKKSLDMKEFFSFYKDDYYANPKSPFVVHFRISTHGGINLDNTHPFMVNDNLAFCHNGILNIPTPEGVSDTRAFNEKILKKLPKGFLTREISIELISGYIGHSKLAFLSNQKKITIINHHLGVTDGGAWYSNESYKHAPIYSKYPLTATKVSDYLDDLDDWPGHYNFGKWERWEKKEPKKLAKVIPPISVEYEWDEITRERTWYVQTEFDRFPYCYSCGFLVHESQWDYDTNQCEDCLKSERIISVNSK